MNTKMYVSERIRLLKFLFRKTLTASARQTRYKPSPAEKVSAEWLTDEESTVWMM